MNPGWIAFSMLVSYLAGIGTALWYGHRYVERMKKEGKNITKFQ